MDGEKKYTYVGKVEIGTDEYRDLIEQLAEASYNADKYRSESWKKDSRISELEKKFNEIKAKYDELAEFIRSDETISTKLKLFRIEKNNKEDM